MRLSPPTSPASSPPHQRHTNPTTTTTTPSPNPPPAHPPTRRAHRASPHSAQILLRSKQICTPSAPTRIPSRSRQTEQTISPSTEQIVTCHPSPRCHPHTPISTRNYRLRIKARYRITPPSWILIPIPVEGCTAVLTAKLGIISPRTATTSNHLNKHTNLSKRNISLHLHTPKHNYNPNNCCSNSSNHKSHNKPCPPAAPA